MVALYSRKKIEFGSWLMTVNSSGVRTVDLREIFVCCVRWTPKRCQQQKPAWESIFGLYWRYQRHYTSSGLVHTVSSILKPSHYFLWTNQADYVPAEGGTEAEIGQETGVAGGDDGNWDESLHQTVESVFKPLVVEGVVERGDEGHHVFGNG